MSKQSDLVNVSQGADGDPLYVDSTNNRVGVGTSSPDELLHIHGATQSYIKLTDDDSGQGATDGALFAFDGSSATQYIWNYENGPTVFATNSTERMRIDSNGALLLGTTSSEVYYNSVNYYNASAVIKTNVSNEVADLVITNGNNDFGSAVEFARTNSAGTDVRFATISAQPTNTTAGSEAGVIRFYTKDTGDSNVVERMRLDSSGRVGIGTSSPVKTLHLNEAAGTNTVLHMTNATTGATDTDGFSIISQETSNDVILAQREAANLVLRTSDTERLRIDSSGNVLVGTTSTGGGKCVIEDTSANQLVLSNTDTGAAAQYACYFLRNNSIVGSIQTTNTATSYVTSSDYRLKEDWQPMTGASNRVLALKPVNFAWKVDGTRVDGFLAHEVQEVVPEAATGTYNEIDAEGNPVYQGIDQSKLVPLLTAALQEALQKIETLEARVAALEA